MTYLLLVCKSQFSNFVNKVLFEILQLFTTIFFTVHQSSRLDLSFRIKIITILIFYHCALLVRQNLPNIGSNLDVEKEREREREVICFKVSALMGCKGPIIKI